MKRTLLLPLLAALALSATACQKQQTEAEKNAEVERQVQERLNAERSADDRQKMAERQAALEARINALAAAQKKAPATATLAPNEPSSTPARVSSASDADADADTGSYSTFYRKLEPYGDWMETNDYGYVFQPRQAAQARDWRPYTNGHWVYTDAGWTWISDERFGWATYHYGRWVRLRSVGWVWVPGEQWAPAWVSWRKGGDYVGWAPLPPEAQFNRQTGIRNWADNYYDIGPEQYAFVPANEFGRKITQREIVPIERNVTIINNTVNVTNIVYNNSVIVDQGPSYDDLRQQSRQPIARYRLERTQNMPNDVPVFKGEVVALPTVDFRQAERATRPNRVTRSISQTVAERGWAGIQNAQAAQKARAKMEAEATPPPNLPPKRFVRPDRPAAVPSVPGPVKTGRPGKPTIPTSNPTLLGTPVPAPRVPPPTVAPTASPRPTPTEAPSPRKGGKGNRPGPTATAAPAATANPVATATPAAAVADPTPPVPAENVVSPKEADRNAARAAQQEKMKQRAEQQAQRQAERQQKMQERRGQKPGRPEVAAPEQPAAATPSAAEAPPPAPAASAAPDAPDKMTADEKRRAKRAERRTKKAQGQADQSPEPDESATPEAHQP